MPYPRLRLRPMFLPTVVQNQRTTASRQQSTRQLLQLWTRNQGSAGYGQCAGQEHRQNQLHETCDFTSVFPQCHTHWCGTNVEYNESGISLFAFPTPITLCNCRVKRLFAPPPRLQIIWRSRGKSPMAYTSMSESRRRKRSMRSIWARSYESARRFVCIAFAAGQICYPL